MKKLLEMLEDNSGGTSSSRAMMLLWGLGTLGIWSYISIKTAVLVAIPETVLILILGLSAGKVIQRFGEKPNNDNKEE